MKQKGNLFKSAYTGEYISFDTQFQTEKKRAKDSFTKSITDYCTRLKAHIDEIIKYDLSKYFTNAGKKVIKNFEDYKGSILEFTGRGMYNLSKSDIIELLKGDAIKLYSGTYIKGNPLGDVTELKTAFLRFLYYEYVSVELNEILELWQSILEIYDRIKLTKAVLTHDDVAYYTYKYLYMPEYSMIDTKNFIVENLFYEFLAVRNQHLLIDEFQDTSLIQFFILAPMIKELSSGSSIYDDTSVIIVGDEKQSIYGWRNGEKGLLNFMQSYLDTSIESLTTCYRSAPVIMDFVNSIFHEKNFQNFVHEQNEENWAYKGDITPANTEKKGTVYNYFHKDDKELSPHLEFINHSVLPAVKNMQDSLGDIAIITRKNTDLEIIIQLLNENNIPCILESSNSIFNHTISKIIIYFMRSLQYNDYNAFLRFLRSDAVYIDLPELKKIAVEISNTECPLFEGEIGNLNPLTLCHDIVNRFKLTNIFNKEIDIKNLHTFMNIIADFLNSPGEYSANLDGFIRYAEVMQQKASQKQTSIQDKNAIFLTTIHKSKGLGFETVFIYFNTKNSHHNFLQPVHINCLIDNKSFDQLSDFFLTINFNSVLKELFSKEFGLIEHKNTIEELNTYYVAITRAKTNLSIFWLYDEKEIESENLPLSTHIAKLALDTCNNTPHFTNSEMITEKTITQTQNLDYLNSEILQKYIDIPKQNLILNKIHDISDNINLKDIYINKKSMLYGNAAHYYLSFIKYDTKEEHKLAHLQTINQFGNILSNPELDIIIKSAKMFITKNKDYYCEKWNKVFNEFTILDRYNKTYRIDRLMINTISKQIMIIDYKTGQIEDDNQLDRYINIIKALPVCKNDDYQVNGMYCRLELGN